MEVDKPEDSSTGDTPEVVVDPAVPVIPDAGEAVADPAIPVVPDAGARAPQEAEVPAPSQPEISGDEKAHFCGFDFKTTVHVPPQDPADPVAGPSQRKSYLRRRLVEDEYTRRIRNRRGQVPSAQIPQAPAPPKPVICEETIDISDDTTDPDPQASAEPKPGTSKASDIPDRTPDPDAQASESKSGPSNEYIDLSDMPECPDFIFMDYMAPLLEGLIRSKRLYMVNSPPPRSQNEEVIELCEKMQRKILSDGHWGESPEPERVEPVPVEEVAVPGTSKQSRSTTPITGWHALMSPVHHKVPDSSRPTTPTVEDKSPMSDLMFLDEDALLEAPTETLAEASLQEVSAMDTSKPSSPSSSRTSKQSPPPSIDDVSKDASYTTGTSKRSPPASIDDVSKDTSYTIDTLKPSPPASTDTSKISPPASVDVSKDKTAMDEDAQLEPPTGTLQDEDAQLEPPIGKSVEACLKEFTADIPKLSPLSSVGDDSKGTSSTMDTSKRSPAASVDDVSKDKSSILGEARSRESTEHEEVQKTPPMLETVLGIEAPSGFLARLSPMVQSPQRSPQRVPGVSKLSSAAASRDGSKQPTTSSVASGTSRKRLLERDEDEEPPTVYLAIDESDETVEYETRRTLATVLSELDDASRQSSATALQDASRQSSLSAASMSEESLTKAVARQALAAVISQVEEPSLEGVTSMDTSKPSSQTSMDDASKGTTSTFEEEIYMQPDTFAVDEDAEKGLTLYETLLANEARAGIRPRVSPAVGPSQPGLRTAPRDGGSPEAMEVDEAAQPGAPEVLVGVPQPVPAQVPAGSPQPGPSRRHDDSPQPGPSGLSAQRRKPVFVSSDESSLSNESSDSTQARKTLKVFCSRMYLSGLPDEEVEEVRNLMAVASATLEVLDNGNSPFSLFGDLFGDIISNQYLMFELVKASARERPGLNSELENQCKMNYMTMLKIERLIKLYLEQEGLNRYLRGVLKYIQVTVHELDVFNHALYRYRGLTSLHSKIMADRIWKHVVKLQERNISDRIRKKKNESVISEFLNNLENSRLQTGYYEDFYNAYKALRDLMQYLRKRYMPEGVVFSMDDLPGIRHAKDHFTMELAVVLPANMLVNFFAQDIVNERVVMDRSAMIEYVRLYVSRLFQTEDNFNKLFRELVKRIPRRQDDEDGEDSAEVQALKEVLFRDYKKFVDELKKIGPFNFLIEEMLDVLAKTLDLLLCLNKFAEKLAATKQNIKQMVRGGPEEIEHKRRFDEYAAEIKCVVKSLQEYVYKKIMIMQVKLRSLKNDLYGVAYNSFVDLLRVKIHELDRINTDRSIYKSPEYISYTGKTSDDLWPQKVNEVHQNLKSRFYYKGQTPKEELPDAERKFIERQHKLFSDNTYREAVRLLLALCTAVGSLEVYFKVKIEEIMSYTSASVDDDADLEAVAANVADPAVDMPAAAVDEAAAVAVDVADAAVDEAVEVDAAAVAIDVADAAAVAIDVADAAAVAIDVADAAAVAIDVADAAAVAIDVADAAAVAIDVADAAAVAIDLTDAAAAVVDVADATAAVADVADIPAPAVGKVDGAVDMTDAPTATVDISASSAADETEDL